MKSEREIMRMITVVGNSDRCKRMISLISLVLSFSYRERETRVTKKLIKLIVLMILILMIIIMITNWQIYKIKGEKAATTSVSIVKQPRQRKSTATTTIIIMNKAIIIRIRMLSIKHTENTISQGSRLSHLLQ